MDRVLIGVRSGGGCEREEQNEEAVHIPSSRLVFGCRRLGRIFLVFTHFEADLRDCESSLLQIAGELAFRDPLTGFDEGLRLGSALTGEVMIPRAKPGKGFHFFAGNGGRAFLLQ